MFRHESYTGEWVKATSTIARIDSAVNSQLNRGGFYFSGAVENSSFTHARITRATSIANSTLHKVTITQSNNLRVTDSTITDSSITLPGDYTRLTMHYSVLDALSTVSAKYLDVSHNYWGSTDLAAIALQTSYSPVQTKDTHLYPIISSSDLYNADADGDLIPDYLDHDNDNDGYSDLQEDWASDPLFQSIYNPLDANSHPSTEQDNDMDGIADALDIDDDNDGLTDTDELIRLTSPYLADSDGDGANDADEISYKYNPLDKANYPLMGNISGKTIDNSNVNSDGVVYIAGYIDTDPMMDGGEYVVPVNLNNVVVSAGTALMIEKDTPVYFNNSIIEGNDANVITIRATGTGNGQLYFNNSQVAFANIKMALGLNINQSTTVDRSDLSFNRSWDVSNYGRITNSLISSEATWHNFGLIEQSYITGSSYFYNFDSGTIIASYVNLSYEYSEVYNEGSIDNSFVSNHVYMQNGGSVSNSVIERLGGGNEASVMNSDVNLTSSPNRATFFDNSYIEDEYANYSYTGSGEPVDEIGDGIAETIFQLGSTTYTVDGITNPRSTPNFPNLVFKPYLDANGIWSPKGVGAWWDMNDAATFPESDPDQSIGTISGQVDVLDFANNSGVAVSINNTSLSTVTDSDGNWSIRLPARDYANGITFSKAYIAPVVKTRSYSVVAQTDTDVGLVELNQTTAKLSG
ncbi:MAG: hypothetical protein P8M49_13800, partial [Thalassotalea sp.]|nr:hypothetical protein [Thalassotalea sp.]